MQKFEMQNKLNSYQYPTHPEPDGNVRGASLLPCDGAAAAGMTAKGQCLFKLPLPLFCISNFLKKNLGECFCSE